MYVLLSCLFKRYRRLSLGWCCLLKISLISILVHCLPKVSQLSCLICVTKINSSGTYLNITLLF